MTIMTSYQCTWCGEEAPQEGVLTTCHCGRPLAVLFDWGSAAPDRKSIIDGDNSLWRYREVLPPIDDHHIVSLGEGWTPTTDAVEYNGVTIYFKDEGVNPTGSFKDRGMAMAVSHAKKNGITELCLKSNVTFFFRIQSLPLLLKRLNSLEPTFGWAGRPSLRRRPKCVKRCETDGLTSPH